MIRIYQYINHNELSDNYIKSANKRPTEEEKKQKQNHRQKIYNKKIYTSSECGKQLKNCYDNKILPLESWTEIRNFIFWSTNSKCPEFYFLKKIPAICGYNCI